MEILFGQLKTHLAGKCAFERCFYIDSVSDMSPENIKPFDLFSQAQLYSEGVIADSLHKTVRLVMCWMAGVLLMPTVLPSVQCRRHGWFWGTRLGHHWY